VYTGYYCRRNPRVEAHFKDSGIDGRIILKLFFKKWNGGMD
jgi:hypothetical protein